MAREINRLSARKVQTMTSPGRHADGGGLYLVIDPSGAKRWAMLYRFGGRRREMGLGSVHAVPLAKAREIAAAARALIADRVDPVNERQQAKPRSPKTFAEVATGYMADREKTWRNAAHRAQWRQTLEVQAAKIWGMPVADVTTDDVVATLHPLWHTKAETARRLRGRIEKVLDAARVGGHRAGENPARWRGHLEVLLPVPERLVRGHHPALPYSDLPTFYAKLVGLEAPSALALRFLILTAARSGEVRGMPEGELNDDVTLWTVPKERMKAHREHRVPLSLAARKIIMRVPSTGEDPSALVFAAASGRAMSDAVFARLMERHGHADITTHGFRSTFREWVDNETDFPGELAEAALAHLTGDETERAYRRGDALAKRRHLMDAWAAFVVGESSAELNKRDNAS